jgi:tetratricopeptide (TPR) repeat protein
MGVNLYMSGEPKMIVNTNKVWALALGVSLLAGSIFSMAPQAQAAKRVYKASTSYVRANANRGADTYLQTGQYLGAESKYTAILKRSPKSTTARASAAMAQAELFKLDAAEKNANEVLSKNPRNGMAHLAKGVVFRNRTASLDMTYKNQRGELLEKSVAELKQAISYEPKLPEAHNQLGVTYRFMGRNAEAMTEFQRALELDPQYSEAVLNEGIMRMSSGDSAGAKTQFERAIKMNSKNYMAHYRLGEAYLQAGDAHQSLSSLNTALSLDRGNAAIMSKMGDAYQAQGNTAAAIANYRKAIQANPSFMPAYMSVSDILDNRGDGEAAMVELRSALNVNPHYTAGRNRLGHIALTVDKPDQALQYYKEALKENPSDPEAINGLSQSLTVVAQKQANWSQNMGADSDLVNAEQSIQEALRLNPNDLRLHLANLRISQLAGKPAMSETELNNLATMTPRNESEQMIQGEAFLALGRYQDADQLFGGLIQANANNPDKLLIIGDTLKVNGNLMGAQKAYQSVLAVEPGNLKAQRGLQRIETAQAESQKTLRTAKALNGWRRTGKESSIDFYEETLSKNPRQPEPRLELSKLYEKTRQFDKAARSYQYYVALRPDMTEKEREHYMKKIAHLQELAQEYGGPKSASTATSLQSATTGAFTNPVAKPTQMAKP